MAWSRMDRILFRHFLPYTLWIVLLFGTAEAQGADAPAGFVGAPACASCHADETAGWKTSHHGLAMQPASESSVLGDFNAAVFEHDGVRSVFSREGGRFSVRTEGPDGQPHDYAIAYTFGVAPLQQYLIAMPGGRLQALGIAWDSRPREQGGQRWFHLYPDQKLSAHDRLHWTGRDQTWNYQCASCHSTDLQKNFDVAKNSYSTTWSDVNVSCEACHGPGSRHVAWAQARAPSAPAPAADDRMGLTAWLKPTDAGHWEMNAETGIARRTAPLVSAELDTCAACHARREVIAKKPMPGAPFLDGYMPALLEPGLYHADGQIDGEVFEYGSFLQSRMHQQGVTCSDCHQPHSAALRAQGNTLCAQCHMPQKFDTAEHHHHAPGSAGAQCVDCHMPTKTYMIVDARRDHSIRVPRPDLSVALGTPNACTQCHTGKTASWAAQAVAAWYPNGRQTQPHYATALNAGRTGAADAERQLDALILNSAQPAIARASALVMLPRYASAASEAAYTAALTDPDPLVRAAAPRGLPANLTSLMVKATAPLLSDPVRAVRVAAARALAGIDPQTLTPEQRSAFGAAYLELYAAEMVESDRPEAHLNLGLLDIRRRQPDAADAEYRTALALDPNFVPALVNLADLDRMRGQDQQGVDELRKALTVEPDNADVHHALGLLLVRQHNYADAVAQLRRASELAPDNGRYAYVYAIALNSTGAKDQAMALLLRAHAQHPADRDVLFGLVSFARDRGDTASALRYARELAALNPGDIQLQLLIRQLEKGNPP
jgi:predicted CXXCH cytochrome family protein